MKTPVDDLTIMAKSAASRPAPMFSICVPQFNRTSFLMEACRSLVSQSFSSFEVCIADDQSNDGRERELIDFLESSGLDFTYARQVRNRRYDGNLRSAIAMARGQFVFLLGNDDRLAESDTLERIAGLLTQFAPVHVAITNYAELGTGRTFERIPRSGELGSGPLVAAQSFRNFSFVSGVIFDTREAHRWATDKWDGSEMYQMYIGCRVLAAGGTLLGIGDICIQKDIQIAHEAVDSYASTKIVKRDFAPVSLPMSKIVPLVADAISPYLTQRALEETVMRIANRLLMFTYAFWLIELRRVQSWRYAYCVYRGLAPRRVLTGLRISWPKKALFGLLYAAVGTAGLTVPVRIFQRLETILYRLAKRAPALSPSPSNS